MRKHPLGDSFLEGIGVLRVSDRVVYREIDDKIVLINLDSGFYYSLNEVGCFIFNRILKSKEVGDILDEIESTFEVSQREAREDLDGFVESLRREKIILANG
ncbi:MAG: PqqD family protein [Candidatus Krumholzibacteria bacterium]|nr:PqqD family protein [Candidatus Krumholzibacteria bacterium]